MNLLLDYLKINNITKSHFEKISKKSINQIRTLNNKSFEEMSIENINLIAKTVNKDRKEVINELEILEKQHKDNNIGRYNLENRRYIGNKTKLMHWIREIILKETKGKNFLDVFAGTGAVSRALLNDFDSITLNDFLYSNEIIYKGFFSPDNYDGEKLKKIATEFNESFITYYDDTYFKDNYGGKFFSFNDARKIGEIRERIEKKDDLNNKEYAILVASLIYSADKCSNTVGHYDAYRKNVELVDKFKFELINPIKIYDTNINIYRKDANELVKNITTDVVFIDPPYNSRQYSRFYHVLEGLAKWNKPKLTGVAMKPPVENMSEYSKSKAVEAFSDLISNLDSRYIVVIYNNTYESKSSSSRNKITHNQIIDVLKERGKTKQFEKEYKYFNSGKTQFANHKEFLFITEVGKFD
ncbi:DNA adenine methylase [Staphylococcus sp. GDX8P80P]|uniref:DNA adenine methylase n=1 Tax=Staphylococcus sp. GDX8P80P TaxID=2804104 RepID=UPI001FDA3917|nr:DNA adenine methylase [Staphylococcus sp. GDX8P80P]